ncbi:NAD(P)/FAD-dependent oxidoreductase [Aquisalimonas sp. APHAB1-3]|uniref:NAD(P)/FAD-dependent oxidoreductase n=1 Tax=Aquisalimonas sp. APHAB1-3 TaxID=3402080 RepID=UPI003AB0E09A
MRVVVVGAGLAGLSCARLLHTAGVDVTVLEKSRGPGGRLTTRRRDDWQGDLGAQYFTARDPEFVESVAEWQEAGVAAPWHGRLVRLHGADNRDVADGQRRWVGVPRMSAITRWLASDLDVRPQTRVTGLRRGGAGWQLDTDEGGRLDEVDQVVLAVPPPQAEPLLRPHVPSLAAAARSARMQSCWAAVFRGLEPAPAFDAAFVMEHPLRWVARDGSKPGRGNSGIWVAHGSGGWSDARMVMEPDDVAPELAAALADTLGLSASPEVLSVHRWRYSQCVEPLTDGYLLDTESGLAACGDWCNGDRVEGACLSGQRLARALTASHQSC